MTIRDWYELVRIQLKREEGQTMAEYGLLIALVALVMLAAIAIFTGALGDTFDTIANKL